VWWSPTLRPKQKDHRYHLVGANAAAFLFNADEFGDQTFATMLTNSRSFSMLVEGSR
jgi:hypothetical protein